MSGVGGSSGALAEVDPLTLPDGGRGSKPGDRTVVGPPLAVGALAWLLWPGLGAVADGGSADGANADGGSGSRLPIQTRPVPGPSSARAGAIRAPGTASSPSRTAAVTPDRADAHTSARRFQRLPSGPGIGFTTFVPPAVLYGRSKNATSDQFASHFSVCTSKITRNLFLYRDF
jgi:hypothetical protein